MSIFTEKRETQKPKRETQKSKREMQKQIFFKQQKIQRSRFVNHSLFVKLG